jgi:peptide-methionine (R)-S-oxide reductase
MTEENKKSDQEWKLDLSPEQFKVLRQCGTEPPFSGKYVHHKEDGTYVCAGCGNELFSSETKFESGSGWPSFWEKMSDESVEFHEDNSHGMRRTEVVCKKCGGHLGHVFNDGPNPTGLRYCINSLSLDFKPKEE